MLLHLAVPLCFGLVAGCPNGMTPVDRFALNGSNWVACEDLQHPGGALALVGDGGSQEGQVLEWFQKG